MARRFRLFLLAIVIITTVLLFFFVCDQAMGNFITDVIDIKTVCAPDSMLCSHGGRAFRDRDHNCEFTPCEFVDPPRVAPTPAPGSQRMGNATTWFRNEEFFVPRIRFRDLKRGKKIAGRVTKALHVKSQRAIEWSTTGSGGGGNSSVDTVDIVAVPSRLSTHLQLGEQSKNNRTEAHNELLQDTLSTGGDLNLAQQGKLLVASRKPWTRFAFFGWLAQHPTSANVMKMLRVVQDANSLDTLIKQRQQQQQSAGSSRGIFDVATDQLPKQIVAIPSLVLMNASMEGNRRDNGAEDAEKENWFARQPEAVLIQVFEFLERRLLQMGHLEPQHPVNTVETRSGTLNASTVKTKSSTSDDTNMKRTKSVNRSVKFASRYKSESASLRVFLTPFASLVGENDDDGGDAKEIAGTYIHSVSVWNFTMVLCGAFEKMRREHPHSSVPLTVLVKRDVDSSNSTGTGAGALMASSEHSNSFDADERSSSSSSASIATEESSFVFSCWVYQQIEDGRGLPVTNASVAMQAVRYYHL